MSRWRRQQRKRALRRRLVDRAQLFAAIAAQVEAYVERRLREPVGAPKQVEGHFTDWLGGWFPKPKFDVKARIGPTGKTLIVDVTARNPSPALAAALLEAGGKWV